MDKENILTEGALSYIFNLLKLGKNLPKRALTKDERKLLKDPKFGKALRDFNKQYDKTIKHLKDGEKKYPGMDLKKYGIDQRENKWP